MNYEKEYLDKLVNMANQIVENLQFGKTEEVLQADAFSHIKRLWTPAMYQAIIENMESLSEQLHPVSIKVFNQLKTS